MDSPRRQLVWEATRARKRNLIDAKQFDTIRRLAKEPGSEDKLEAFLASFLLQLAKLDPTFACSTSTVTAAASPVSCILETLPQAVATTHIAKFLPNQDLINLAQTSFGVNSLFFPANGWVKLLLSCDSSAELESILLALFPGRESSCFTRSESLARFSRGVGFLQLDGDAKKIRYYAMMLYLTQTNEEENGRARIYQLHLKLHVALRGKNTGDALLLESAHFPDFQSVTLHFKVVGTPAILHLGDEQSIVVLHGLLASDGRSIVPIPGCTFTCGQRASNGAKVHLRHHHHRAPPAQEEEDDDGLFFAGMAGITLCGERAARQLGRLMFNDELHFQVQLTASANGAHGLANQLNMGYRENVTLQTPRTTFRVPEAYYEIASAVGVDLTLPLHTLFQHCVKL